MIKAAKLVGVVQILRTLEGREGSRESLRGKVGKGRGRGTQCIFTSMFVERMEVLEYRQKFEVELSTFPDSTNT